MRMFTTALLLETKVVVPDKELTILENVFASTVEPNCYGIYLYFITVGGNL